VPRAAAAERKSAKPPEGIGAKPAENSKPRPPDGSSAKPAENSRPRPPEGSSAKPAENSKPKPESAEEAAPKSRLVSILGREVANREGDSGRVIDVLVDLDGYSGAVVVEFGGFLGIGSRKIAVAWGALRFVREGDRTHLTVDVTREQIRDTPEYKPNEPPAVLTTKAK
jgi:hypothetical protein